MAHTLTQKVLIAGLLLCLVVVGLAGCQIAGRGSTRAAFDRLTEVAIERTPLQDDWHHALGRAVNAALLYASLHREADRDAAYQALREARTPVAMLAAQQLPPAPLGARPTPAQAGADPRPATLMDETQEQVDQLFAAEKAGNPTERRQALVALDALSQAIDQSATQEQDALRRDARAVSAQLNSLVETGLSTALLTYALILLLIVLAALLTRQQIVLPIGELAQVAEAVAAGDRHQRVRITCGAEIGALQRSFNDMVGDIRAQEAALIERNSELLASLGEQQASEERYRGLLEISPDAIVLAALDGTILLCNQQAARLYGAGSAEALRAQNGFGLVAAEDYARARRDAARVRAKGSLQALEYTFVRHDGTRLPVEASIALALATDGAPPSFLCSFRDISERKKVDRLKNEFISVVSHELRTPLTSIRGALGLVAGGMVGDIGPQAREMVEIAYNNSERLVRLINDILDIQKIESGQMAFQLKPLEVMPLIVQAFDANRSYIEQWGARLILEAPLPGAFVRTDADRVLQVLTNLLANAAKFSPPGGLIRVAVTRVGGAIRIAVADDGPGIPVEFRPRLFEKFAQADASNTRQKGGTGLGLSIVKAIVEHLGGQVGYGSGLGEGARFYFDLPEWPPDHCGERTVAGASPAPTIAPLPRREYAYDRSSA